MKKYLEERVNDLEKEIEKLKSKNDLHTIDYAHNVSVNLLSEPDLETAFPSPFDKSELHNFSLDTITVTVPTHLDTDMGGVSPDQQNLSFEDYPQYPNIIGSWDENPDDVVDEYGFQYNYPK